MISLIFALLLCLNLAGGVYATAETAYVYDDADLLSYEEETALAQKLESYSDTCDAQLVVVTVDRIEGDVDAYTDDLYDRMAFGFGPDRDGVLLLVSMDPRQYRILSNG